MSEESPEESLRPYEPIITHVYEILVFKRPFSLVLLIMLFGSFFASVRQSEAGPLASIALFIAIYYMVYCFFGFFGTRFAGFLFPEKDFAGRASYERLARTLSYILPGFENSIFTKYRPVVGLAFIGLGVLGLFVDEFWYGVGLVVVSLLLPGILFLAKVSPLWDPEHPGPAPPVPPTPAAPPGPAVPGQPQAPPEEAGVRRSRRMKQITNPDGEVVEVPEEYSGEGEG
jgi:hypothetical protein